MTWLFCYLIHISPPNQPSRPPPLKVGINLKNSTRKSLEPSQSSKLGHRKQSFLWNCCRAYLHRAAHIITLPLKPLSNATPTFQNISHGRSTFRLPHFTVPPLQNNIQQHRHPGLRSQPSAKNFQTLVRHVKLPAHTSLSVTRYLPCHRILILSSIDPAAEDLTL